MDYDTILVSPSKAVGLTIVQSGQSINTISTQLPGGYSIFANGSQLIFVTPFGAYLAGDQITATKFVSSIEKLKDADFYIVRFGGEGVSPAAGTLDFSDPANSDLIAGL